MANRIRLSILMLALLMGGAGCVPRQKGNVPPKKSEVLQKFDQAESVKGSAREYTFSASGERISVILPEDWTGSGPIWRPAVSSTNQIRIATFAQNSASQEWTLQQGQDIHQVLDARSENDRFLLIVHHPAMKAILVKLFLPKTELLAGYTFAECRIADEQANDPALWSACKTALESITTK
jgi:hypothetical protein